MKLIATLLTVPLLIFSGACNFSKSGAPPTSRPSGQASQSSETPGHSDQASSTPSPAEPQNDELHTPEKGSEERQAIMDTLRGDRQIQFQVLFLKVHNGWCWVDTTPLDMSGRAIAEGGPNLLHRENGSWRIMDLSRVPEDPNDPLGAEDASPTYVRNVMKAFPGVPRDIFPKPSG